MQFCLCSSQSLLKGTSASVLRCLQARYSADMFYTNAGCTLVALNPFKPVPQLYSTELMQEYHAAPQPQVRLTASHGLGAPPPPQSHLAASLCLSMCLPARQSFRVYWCHGLAHQELTEFWTHNSRFRVPSVTRRDHQCLWSTGTQVRSRVWQNEFRIWYCCSCAMGHNSGSHLIPNSVTPHAMGWPRKPKNWEVQNGK